MLSSTRSSAGHTPQSSVYYRWMAAFWRIGEGGLQNPFQQQILHLEPTDHLFGEAFRLVLATQAEVPPEVIDAVRGGQTIHEAVRAAGYPEVADRLRALDERIAADAKREKPPDRDRLMAWVRVPQALESELPEPFASSLRRSSSGTYEAARVDR